MSPVLRLLKILLALPVFTMAAPPANDHFNDATPLSGLPILQSGTTNEATTEPGELGTKESVWYEWESPISGVVTIRAIGLSNILPQFNAAIYSGNSLANLDLRAVSGGIFSSPHAKFAAHVEAGQRYRIVVGKTTIPAFEFLNTPEGAFNLEIANAGTELPHTTFASALDLGSAERFSLFGFVTDPSEAPEPGEPFTGTQYLGGTQWFRWRAPRSGPVQIDLGSPGVQQIQFDPDPAAEIFIANAPGFSGLVPLKRGSRAGIATQFEAISGIDYVIAVGFSNALPYRVPGQPGAINLTLTIANPTLPGNSFATRQPLPSRLPSSASVPSGGGTSNPSGLLDISKWFSWIAPSSGSVRFSTNTKQSLSVAPSETPDSPTLPINPGVPLTTSSDIYNVIAGIEYQIRCIDPGTIDEITLSVAAAPTPIDPLNDDFANATDIGSTTNLITITNLKRATIEPHERDHSLPAPFHCPGVINGFSTKRSLWYRWHAPQPGFYRAHFSQESPAQELSIQPAPQILAIYSGDTLWSIIRHAAGGTGDPIYFQATPNTPLQICIADFRGTLPKGLTFSIERLESDPPPNDHFVNALPITSAPISIPSSILSATAEPSEPAEPVTYSGDDHTIEASAWFRFTAPRPATYTFQIGDRASGKTLPFLLATYSIQENENLIYTAHTYSAPLKLSLKEGQEIALSIASTSRSPARADFTLKIDAGVPRATNDALADAAIIPSSIPASLIIPGPFNGTREDSDPRSAPGICLNSSPAPTLWWQWTAPEDINTPVIASFIDQHTQLPASPTRGFRILSEETQIAPATNASLGNSRLIFFPEPRKTYHLLIEGDDFSSQNYEISLIAAPTSPTNNTQAKAIPLPSTTGRLSIPAAIITESSPSAYWSWIAPGNGHLHLGFSPENLQIYGFSNVQLFQEEIPIPKSLNSYSVTADTRYTIRLSSNGGLIPNGFLNYSFFPDTPYEAFARTAGGGTTIHRDRDTDQDGISNIAEFFHGTNPTSPNRTPLEFSNNTLQFQGSGARIELESSSDLTTFSFQKTLTPQSDDQYQVELPRNGSTRFYRLRYIDPTSSR